MLHLRARLHQRHARPGQIAPGVHRRRREKARIDQAMGEACRQPSGIGCLGLLAWPLAHRAGMGDDDCQRVHHDMGEGLPGHSRALEDRDGAPVLGEPGPQGQEWRIRGANVPPRRADLPVVMPPAQTCRPRRRMAIHSTTNGGNHVHDVALLDGGADHGGDGSAPALRGVLPTRDLTMSTWRGAASGTNRFLSGLQALTMSTVLWLTSWCL